MDDVETGGVLTPKNKGTSLNTKSSLSICLPLRTKRTYSNIALANKRLSFVDWLTSLSISLSSDC